VRAALARMLGALGIEVHVPPDQGCCGALHAHAGNLEGAEALATRNRSAFGEASDAPPVLTLASGCHESVAGALPGRAIDALEFLDRHVDLLSFSSRPERIGPQLPRR